MSNAAGAASTRVGHRLGIAHEWVASRAGSEKVFERLAAALPHDAELLALTVDPDVPFDTGGRPIQSTFLDRPWLRDRRALTLPLMPLAWRRLARRHRYDVIVTSSHAFVREFAHAQPAATHLCYVHSPMRYAWERGVDPRSDHAWTSLPAAALRKLDARSVRSVDAFAANSFETQARIRRHYGRDSHVIHPPVDSDFFGTAQRSPDDYLLAYGRFIEYKRFDLAIGVAAEIGMPLRIAGSGPLESELRTIAAASGVRVDFSISPSDDELLELLEGAQLLLFPGVEDFGIVPVEAQAAGVPVVGPALGGLCDTVIDGETGILVPEQTVESLVGGVRRTLAHQLGGTECRANAHRFRPERFDAEVRGWVGEFANGAMPAE